MLDRTTTATSRAQPCSAPSAGELSDTDESKGFDGRDASVRVKRFAMTPDVLKRLQRGDRTALRTVYDRLGGRLYAICRRILVDDQLAEDALQNAFVQIWKKSSSVRTPEAFVSWCSKVTANAALQLLRTERPDETIRGLSLEAAASASATGREHHRSESNAGDRLDLQSAIDRLTPRRRSVLVLHDVEGYRHREIGDLLGISVGTSKAHLFQARAELKKYLER